jgi:hypothetical protein
LSNGLPRFWWVSVSQIIKRRVDSSNPKPDNVEARKHSYFSGRSRGLKKNRPLDWSGQFNLLVASNCSFHARQRLVDQ